MTVLVTGGAGFIGSHVVDRLLAAGRHVRVLDDLSTGRADRLPSGVEVLVGDVRSAAAVEKAAKGCTYIVHLAARNSVPRSVECPSSCVEVNVSGTLHTLEAARKLGIRGVVLASSSAAVRDAQGRTAGRSPYATSKAAVEDLGACWQATYGLPVTTLRFFNVYGPRQRGDLQWPAVVPSFIGAALGGERARIHGDGLQTRDFTWVGDAARACVLALEAPAMASPGVHDIGGGTPTSVLDLHRLVSEYAGGIHVQPVHTAARTGDLRLSRAELGTAWETLSYAPTVAIRHGIKTTVEWWQSEGERERERRRRTEAGRASRNEGVRP